MYLLDDLLSLSSSQLDNLSHDSLSLRDLRAIISKSWSVKRVIQTHVIDQDANCIKELNSFRIALPPTTFDRSF